MHRLAVQQQSAAQHVACRADKATIATIASVALIFSVKI